MFAPYAVGASLLVAIFTNFRNVTRPVKMRSIYTFGISVLSSALGMILLRLASVVGLVVVGKESGAMFIKQPVESVARAFEFFVDALSWYRSELTSPEHRFTVPKLLSLS